MNDPSSGLAEKVGRDIGQYTVALLSVSGHGESETLHFRGSGTLVRVTDQAYILTAYHVWEEIKAAVGIGLTLNEEDVD
ncbi:MAG TPA: hypothetical protein VMB47_07675, partial [Candidatus Aquilonibacter sp.]|nr:hypothetical protein [Candidatus Aquilonibacter sp.]